MNAQKRYVFTGYIARYNDYDIPNYTYNHTHNGKFLKISENYLRHKAAIIRAIENGCFLGCGLSLEVLR